MGNPLILSPWLQLETLGKQIGVEVLSLGTEADPVDIAKQAVARAVELQKETGKPFTVIVDTAGRQVIDGPLMEELAAIKAAVEPDDTLLVVGKILHEALVRSATFVPGPCQG